MEQELTTLYWRNEWIKSQEEIGHLESAVQDLKSRNKRYREALEFYATRDNYKLEHFDPNLNDYMSTVDYDEGEIARQALEDGNSD